MRRPSRSTLPHDRAEQHGDAGLAHRLLDPARERDLVIHDDGGVGRPATPVMQRVLRAEIAQDLVGNAVCDLMPWLPLANKPQNVPMMEFTAWPPSAGKPSTSSTLRPSLRRLHRRRDAGNAGAEHADVGRHMLRGFAPSARRTTFVAVENSRWRPFRSVRPF